MRLAVLGSGGIGGYYGALLARAGHDVAFIARGAHLEALQERGLTVRTPEGESTIRVNAVVFGEPSGAMTERVRRIAGVFQQSRIPHEVSTDINRVLWEKFLFIAGVGGVTALARWGIGPLLATAEGRLLLTAACEEIAAVARGEGVPLPADAVDRAIRQAATLPPQWRSSMARDLADGRRLEVEALSGAVVRRGLRLGVPTPVHRTIAACLSVHQPSAPEEPAAPVATGRERQRQGD
jgi:ketopantoate reductase